MGDPVRVLLFKGQPRHSCCHDSVWFAEDGENAAIPSFARANSPDRGAADSARPADQKSAESLGRALSRAELFLTAFGPAAKEGALRAKDLEMRENVRDAFWHIDATRREIEQGRLTPSKGEEIIQNWYDRIRDYVHDYGQEALMLATRGQVADLPAISKSLSGLLSIARQDGLMGREQLALEAQKKLVQTLEIGACKRGG